MTCKRVPFLVYYSCNDEFQDPLFLKLCDILKVSIIHWFVINIFVNITNEEMLFWWKLCLNVNCIYNILKTIFPSIYLFITKRSDSIVFVDLTLIINNINVSCPCLLQTRNYVWYWCQQLRRKKSVYKRRRRRNIVLTAAVEEFNFIDQEPQLVAHLCD